MKNKDVVGLLLDYHPHFPEAYNGCDNYKSGNPEDECTGVVVALVPNMDVINKAIELGANLIIAHEPTYFTSKDEAGWFEDFDNQTAKEKEEIIKAHGICIFRDHDHMHAHQPDQIFTGVVENLGWLNKDYKVDYDTGSFANHICHIPPIKFKDLCQHLKETVGLNGMRYLGDPEMMVERVALVGHLFPENEAQYSVNLIKDMENGVDVIMPGETIDWTVASYIRDSLTLGKKKGMITIGHFNIEELGMKYLTERIVELVKDEVKVTYVPSGDMYQYFK